MQTNITLGCDPEGFLWTNGMFVNADGLFPGTKSEPFALEKGAVQVDGVALEFNIDPAKSEDEFDKNISTVLAQIDEMVRKVDPSMRLIFRPIANFPLENWKKFSAGSKVLGCDPDYNFKGDQNPNPSEKLADTPIRVGAGHVHLGWTEGKERGDAMHFADCCYISEQFHTAKIFAPKIADENTRLKYYGANGAFRPKPYGMELRSPSNVWVSDPKTRRNVFNRTVTHFREVTGM